MAAVDHKPAGYQSLPCYQSPGATPLGTPYTTPERIRKLSPESSVSESSTPPAPLGAEKISQEVSDGQVTELFSWGDDSFSSRGDASGDDSFSSRGDGNGPVSGRWRDSAADVEAPLASPRTRRATFSGQVLAAASRHMGSSAPKVLPSSQRKGAPGTAGSRWGRLRSREALRGLIEFDRVLTVHERLWETMHVLAKGREPTVASGEAGLHSFEARHEAALALVRSHYAVLKDVTDPCPLRQIELKRVPREYSLHVDTLLLEVGRRLVGWRLNVPESLMLQSVLEHRLDPTNAKQRRIWRRTAACLSGRIALTPVEMDNDQPLKMSKPAAAALRAVLAETGVGISTSGGLMPGSIIAGAVDRKITTLGRRKAPKKSCVIS